MPPIVEEMDILWLKCYTKAGSIRFAVSPPLVFSFITSSLKTAVTALSQTQISSETQVLDNMMFL